MMIPSIVDLHIFLFLVLFVIFIYVIKGRDRSVSTRMFQWVIIFLSFTVLTEALGWILVFRGHPLALMALSLSLATSSFQSVAWVAYFDYKIYGDLKGLRKRAKLYLITPVVIWITITVNYFSPGLVFKIQASDIVWGWGAVIPPLAVYALVISSLIYFFMNAEMIFGRLTQTLLLFALLPVFGSIIQFFVEHVPVNWAMYTLAVLITFIMVELSELQKDELTNLSTRRHFEERLKYKLKNKDAFGVMMIDLNDFKSINDTKGHYAGDLVLKQVAQVLLTSVNSGDMVCRIGGDEFTIIVESSEALVVQSVRENIEKHIFELNQTLTDITVSLSIGMRMVVMPEAWDYDVLFSDIDNKMYEVKAKMKHRTS